MIDFSNLVATRRQCHEIFNEYLRNIKRWNAEVDVLFEGNPAVTEQNSEKVRKSLAIRTKIKIRDAAVKEQLANLDPEDPARSDLKAEQADLNFELVSIRHELEEVGIKVNDALRGIEADIRADLAARKIEVENYKQARGDLVAEMKEVWPGATNAQIERGLDFGSKLAGIRVESQYEMESPVSLDMVAVQEYSDHFLRTHVEKAPLLFEVLKSQNAEAQLLGVEDCFIASIGEAQMYIDIAQTKTELVSYNATKPQIHFEHENVMKWRHAYTLDAHKRVLSIEDLKQVYVDSLTRELVYQNAAEVLNSNISVEELGMTISHEVETYFERYSKELRSSFPEGSDSFDDEPGLTEDMMRSVIDHIEADAHMVRRFVIQADDIPPPLPSRLFDREYEFPTDEAYDIETDTEALVENQRENEFVREFSFEV